MNISKTGLRNGLQPPTIDERDKRLKKACRDFEALFTYQLIKSMKKSVEKCNLFHGGQGEEIYESLMDMELSKQMADISPGSLGRLLYEQLKGQLGPEGSRNQEGEK